MAQVSAEPWTSRAAYSHSGCIKFGSASLEIPRLASKGPSLPMAVVSVASRDRMAGHLAPSWYSILTASMTEGRRRAQIIVVLPVGRWP